MPNFRLTFINNSNKSGQICLYQAKGQHEVSGSLAWRTQSVNPGTQATFVWANEYCFFWSETGTDPGHANQASQFLPFDPENNLVTLSKINGAYAFGVPEPGPQPGNFFIRTDQTVGINDALVGFGMARSGMVGVSASPNINFTFTPFPWDTYYLAFGQFETGQSLTGADLSLSVPVTFSGTNLAITVALNLDNTWSVLHS